MEYVDRLSTARAEGHEHYLSDTRLEVYTGTLYHMHTSSEFTYNNHPTAIQAR